MAITTYTELQAAVANWLARSDLSSRVPEYIAMAEGWIAYGLDMGQINVPPLRIRAMEATATPSMVAGTQTVALPTRYVAMRNIYINTNPVRKLSPVSPEQRIFEHPVTTAGRPEFFSVEGDNIVFDKVPDSSDALSILYYARFAAFTTGSDTNWLLTNSPNTYLFGALYASSTMTGNPKGAQWLGSFMGAISSLNNSDKSDRYSGGALQMRNATYNP
jgi:hypothetical protein